MKSSIFTMLLVGAFGSAHAGFVDFELDPTGAKPNGWQSVQSGVLTFSDSMGADLSVQDWGIQSNGQGLAVFSDDPSYLIIDASTDLKYLCLSFGNDDPGWSNDGDQAVLTAYKNNVMVAQTSMTMNRNDIMDQTISVYNTGGFDQVTFEYAVTTSGLIEIVDDICYEPVPEPGTIAALGLGLGALVRRRRAAK